MNRKMTGFRSIRVALAIFFNVTVALLVFFLVKRYCRPPLEGWLGIGLWLIPASAHFVYLRGIGILPKLLVSILSLALTLIGALKIALAVFGDA